MREIVNFSMGICSAYIAARLAETCRPPLCVFSDTKREDEDTYRFGKEVAERWKLEVVEASDGRDLWEVFKSEKMIPARQISMCSRRMKIIPGEAALASYDGPFPARVAYGYDIDEQDRADRTSARWPHKHLSVWFPMIEWNISKAQAFGFFQERDIKPPRMYAHFRHANCLPCKNFRMNDWIALRFHYRDKFDEASQFEVDNPGLRWMQDGPLLRDIPEVTPPKKTRRLPMMQPAFSFDMECDACGVD